MHEFLFADAVRPERVVCLRLPLRNYSIGHEIILLSKRNALLISTAEEFSKLPEVERHRALIEAVDVCCQSWNEYHREYSGFRERLKLRRVWRKWNRAIAKSDCAKELEVFKKYLADSRRAFPGPDLEADEIVAKGNGYSPLRGARGRASGAPMAARLLEFLLRNEAVALVAGLETIYDFPFGLANLIYETSLEAEGSARIENGDERDERVNLARIREEYEAEQAALKKSPKSEDGLAIGVPPELLEKDGDRQDACPTGDGE